MADCKRCGKKFGFFSVQKNVGLVSPFCGACSDILVEDITRLVLKYDEQVKAAADPRAAAWCAVANLLCAERVNLLLETYVGIDPMPLKEETWGVSRDKATTYARKAQSHVSAESDEARFLSEIVTRAQRITMGQGVQLKKTRRLASLGLLGGGGALFATEIEAMMSGLVFCADFDATLDSLRG